MKQSRCLFAAGCVYKYLLLSHQLEFQAVALLNVVFDVEMQNSDGINTQRANYCREETAAQTPACVCLCVCIIWCVYVRLVVHFKTLMPKY